MHLNRQPITRTRIQLYRSERHRSSRHHRNTPQPSCLHPSGATRPWQLLSNTCRRPRRNKATTRGTTAVATGTAACLIARILAAQKPSRGTRSRRRRRHAVRRDGDGDSIRVDDCRGGCRGRTGRRLAVASRLAAAAAVGGQAGVETCWAARGGGGWADGSGGFCCLGDACC